MAIPSAFEQSPVLCAEQVEIFVPKNDAFLGKCCNNNYTEFGNQQRIWKSTNATPNLEQMLQRIWKSANLGSDQW